MAKTSGQFKFRRGDNVGAVDAANDRRFLDTCFIDTGDLAVLLDCDNPKCVVVGRTGSGKTALLLEVSKRAQHTEWIAPESLSLNYIANSDVVNVLSSLDVNLDPFFKLLWRHVIALQVFQILRPVSEEEKKKGLFTWIGRFIREDKTSEKKKDRHHRVLQFLEKYGGKEFWSDVGQRVEGMVYKFDKEIQKQRDRNAGLSGGVSAGPLNLSAEFGESRNRSERMASAAEVTVTERQRFQSVVNSMHVTELDGILALVEEVLEDAGRDVYIVIDKLDLQWADESIRFRLIRALIDTAIAFSKVTRLKVILAMRIDLIERVYRDARHDPGTQLEKLDDYKLTLFWTEGALVKALDERVNRLVTDRYAPSYTVTLKDLLASSLRKGRSKGTNTIEFILERSWLRPRDVIEFLNVCIERSADKAKISNDTLLEAEGHYSRRRLRSLSEEWQLEYPFLEETLRTLLSGQTRRLRLSETSDDHLCDWVSMLLTRDEREGDRLRRIAARLDKNEVSFDQAAILYKVGAVGVQSNEDEKALWAGNFSYSLSPNEISQSSYIYIHPGLWKALGVK